MKLSERTASLAGQPPSGSRLAALQAEVAGSGAALRFKNAELEVDYLKDRASGCAAQARSGLLLSTVLAVTFQLLDHFALGMHYPWQVTKVISLVLAPMFVLTWLIMRLQRCKPWIVQINIVAMVIAGLAFAWTAPLMVITSDRSPYAFEALLLYLAVIYFLSGAMFRLASLIAIVMSAIFVLTIASSPVQLRVVGYCAYFLLAFNLVFAIGRYMLDKTYRRNFLTRMIAVELAERDPLTGIYNRRVFEQRLATLLRESARNGSSITVLVLDIDHFKRINDAGGHALGDTALRHIAQALEDIARRPLDSVARLGGDEFAALWMGLPPQEIEARVADLNKRFADRSAGLTARIGYALTLSIGVAHVENSSNHTTQSLLHAADIALYRAKDSGRARTEIEQLPPLQSVPQNP